MDVSPIGDCETIRLSTLHSRLASRSAYLPAPMGCLWERQRSPLPCPGSAQLLFSENATLKGSLRDWIPPMSFGECMLVGYARVSTQEQDRTLQLGMRWGQPWLQAVSS